jgi:putative transposase
MDKEYWNGSHTKHRVKYHLVWIAKYRKRVLVDTLKLRLEQLLHDCAEINRWQIDVLNIQNNHIHMLIQLRPKESISDVVQRFKGGTSRIIREEFPDLKEFLWGDSLWADGYFVESVGDYNENTIKQYIENQ